MRSVAFLALAFLAFVLAIGAASAFDLPEPDFGGQGKLQLVLTVETSSDVVESGESIALLVSVADSFGAPVPGAMVKVEAPGAAVTPAAATTDADGIARFTITATATSVVERDVLVTASKGEAIKDRVGLSLFVVPAPEPRPAMPAAESIGVGLGAFAIAAVASTEFGRYGLFNLAVFPLYSRLKKEEVLDHFVRGQIYGYIQSHPGAHYNRLKEVLQVTNGTLAHHLHTLEMQGFILAHRDGVFKRFYPRTMRIPRGSGIRLSDLQHRILDMLQGDRGPTQQDIADKLAVSQQAASYNLRQLSRQGLVRIERDGRVRRYFPGAT